MLLVIACLDENSKPGHGVGAHTGRAMALSELKRQTMLMLLVWLSRRLKKKSACYVKG
jgi:hypothetical protein